MLSSFREDVGRIEGSVASAVVHDIAPDFEHPEPPHEGLVDRSSSELREVVHITTQCRPSVASELSAHASTSAITGSEGRRTSYPR